MGEDMESLAFAVLEVCSCRNVILLNVYLGEWTCVAFHKKIPPDVRWDER